MSSGLVFFFFLFLFFSPTHWATPFVSPVVVVFSQKANEWNADFIHKINHSENSLNETAKSDKGGAAWMQKGGKKGGGVCGGEQKQNPDAEQEVVARTRTSRFGSRKVLIGEPQDQDVVSLAMPQT